MGNFPFVNGKNLSYDQGMTSSDLKTRLEHALETRAMRPKALSLEAGLNETAIRDILIGKSRNPRTDTTRKIAHALNIRHEWLVDGFGAMEENPHLEKQTLFSDAHPHQRPLNIPTIPLFDAPAQKGNDADINLAASSAHEQIDAPPFINRDGFAIRIRNDKMAPRYKKGEIIYLDPSKPAFPGDEIAVINIDEDGFIGIMNNIRADMISLERLNGEPVSMMRKDVRMIAVIVGSAR